MMKIGLYIKVLKRAPELEVGQMSSSWPLGTVVLANEAKCMLYIIMLRHNVLFLEQPPWRCRTFTVRFVHRRRC